ncbi:MAG TPA: hypothetical protein PLU64_13665 [Saprospiraceae bacterium]|nr:hypothetical protein [Saprospiraceae bacterium]
MRQLLLLPVLAAMAIILFACSNREVEDITIDYGYDYFPLEVGRFWVYQADSITYDPALGGTAIDSFRTFIREVVADTLLDNTGAVLYRIERYERQADTLPWQIRKVFTLSRDEQRAYRTEDNLRFIKLTFPLRTGQSWNGNVFFDPFTKVLVKGESIEMFKSWDYKILTQGEPLQLGGLHFDEVATVQNADSRNNAIEFRVATEQYAKGVGLVSRYLDILDTECRVCCNGDTGDECQALPWEERAEKGFRLYQQLITYQ